MIDNTFKRTPQGALVSTDSQGLKAYKLKKSHARSINKIVEDQEILRNDISEIKSMLAMILKEKTL